MFQITELMSCTFGAAGNDVGFCGFIHDDKLSSNWILSNTPGAFDMWYGPTLNAGFGNYGRFIILEHLDQHRSATAG